MAAYFHNIIFVLSPLVTTEWHILYSWRIFIEMRNLNGLAHGLQNNVRLPLGFWRWHFLNLLQYLSRFPSILSYLTCVITLHCQVNSTYLFFLKSIHFFLNECWMLVNNNTLELTHFSYLMLDIINVQLHICI